MRACPAVGENLSTAHIGGHDDRAGKQAGRVGQPIWILQCARPDDDTMRTVVQQLLDELPASDSAADLDLYLSRAQYSLNLGGVATAAGNGIEVDDVEISKSVLSPRCCDSHWIRNADHFLVVGAARQLDTSAAAQVERGNCDHRVLRLIEAWIMTGEGAALIACWRACE